MITWQELMAILLRIDPYHLKAIDWRKMPNGRIVRFVKWGWRLKR